MFLFPCHQLCVKQNFHFVGSSSDYLLPMQVHVSFRQNRHSSHCWASSLGFPYTIKKNCHHTIPHHFLSIINFSCESPSRVWPIHFFFLFVVVCTYFSLSSPIPSITSLCAVC